MSAFYWYIFGKRKLIKKKGGKSITEKDYYGEIETYIKKNEINKKYRALEESFDNVNTYWHIGELLVKAQGGKTRAKYGNELIKNGVSYYLKSMVKIIMNETLSIIVNFMFYFQM